MTKKLTLGDIKKSNAKYDEKIKVPLDEKTHVEIYPNFDPVKVKELVQGMVLDGVLAKKVGIDFDSINAVEWGLFNIVAKFADLGIPTDINKKVQIFHELMKYEYLDKIINAFPDESITSVTNALTQFKDNLNVMNEQFKVNNDELENNEIKE